MSLIDRIDQRLFDLVRRHNLVYNTCWEDPRLDRVALDLGPDDTVLVVRSAGCNVLDYALTAPRHVYAVDLNPRQNALLELKLAGIRRLDYKRFFALFGRGHLPDARAHIEALLDAPTLERQREIYEQRVRGRFWSPPVRFALDRNATLSMLGVPQAQRRQVESGYDGGIVAFAQECVDAVFGRLPLADNYFWRVYLLGRYTPDCCPEYLKPANFARLKEGLADRVSVHTNSVQHFLEAHDASISRYVLLDHMDWLSDRYFPALVAEWQAIVDRAAPAARAIWRSGGLRTDYIDHVTLRYGGRVRPLPDMLAYHRELAAELHERDRVHTYGSFHIADLMGAAA